MNTKLNKGRPATGETPKRVFRMGQEDWEQAQFAAKLEERNMSEHIRTSIETETSRVFKKHGVAASAE